jgi:CDP-diacylglycerol---glycerol-3-phosphate 3-phosphatidyltransferase
MRDADRAGRLLSSDGAQRRLHRSLRAPWLAATSLSILKPLFQRALRPVAGVLVRSGCTANQITISALVGSLLVGAILMLDDHRPILFALLPVWLLVRMALNTIDGVLAIEFGQKSRTGAVLNEAGDIVSDVALYAPLTSVAPFTPPSVVLIIVLAAVSEFVGMTSSWLNAGRRCEGPFGKSDRAVAFGAIAAWFAIVGSLPAAAAFLMPAFAVLLLATIANRLRFATSEYKGKRT